MTRKPEERVMMISEFRINENSGVPVWIQVRRRLVYCIVSGQLASGDKLPTVRELAVQLDINYNTVNKVYQDLERDGFITTQRGKGTFVATLDEKMLLSLDNKVELLADELVREALEFGMTADELVALVRSRARHLARVQNDSPNAASSSPDSRSAYA